MERALKLTEEEKLVKLLQMSLIWMPLKISLNKIKTQMEIKRSDLHIFRLMS